MLDFLLACVYVLKRIPFHLLHVSALLWLSMLDVYTAGAGVQRLAQWSLN